EQSGGRRRSIEIGVGVEIAGCHRQRTSESRSQYAAGWRGKTLISPTRVENGGHRWNVLRPCKC
ncbi:hypothetical protein ACFL2S_14440, partial [Thermodesulfobacteriota bacterium]